jgi:hypothetical protein
MHCIAHNPLCLLVLYATDQGHRYITQLKIQELGVCVCNVIKIGTENMILILPGHMTEAAHDLTYLKAGMKLFKSCLHKQRYVNYVSLSLVKNAGTGRDM